MQPDQLQALLQSVAQGDVTPNQALTKLKYFDLEPVGGFAQLDHHRALRTGFPEVVWGPGKTPEQLVKIIQALQADQPVVMATRIEPQVYEQIAPKLPGLRYYPEARICAMVNERSPETNASEPNASEPNASEPSASEPNASEPSASQAIAPRYPGTITLVSAGTSDLPVAEEAAVTADLCGFRTQRLWDVGVSGIHRLLAHRHLIAEADVLIVVAGMEGALPSVVTGLAACPVVAVPTSVGYGTQFNGLTPLLTMLNSCATGLGVVNIDNGFGAAMLAAKILRTAERLAK